MSYADFLESKVRRHHPVGHDVDVGDVHPMLHPWQAELVVWATKVGRAAIWADTGLGKTLIQIEWLRLMGKRCLIVAPLAVCAQTIREGEKIGVAITYLREGVDLEPGIYITNFEMADRFDPSTLDAMVLDEASILKQSTGAMRTMLVKHFESVPYRLACTATPAPNDTEELTNQAAFLGVITRADMLAAYFVHDADKGWRVKRPARLPLYRWMSEWAVAIRRPSDMGYPDEGYALPGLVIHDHLIDVDVVPDDQLFATSIGGVGGRAKVRKGSLAARVEKTADLVAADSDQWVIWVGLNDEQDYLAKLLGNDARSIDGRTKIDDRIIINEDWIDGKFRVLLVKPGMYSYGMNWQHCHQMAFVGLSDSYESYYQCIRRCYRYGQTEVVHAHVVLSQLEGQIAQNVRRKESEAAATTAALVAEMRAARMSE